MSEFKLASDADAPDVEIDRARRLLRDGEISTEDFGWLMGYVDDQAEVPFHRMTQAQKRRYFAQRRQADLFGPAGARKRRRRKAKSSSLIRPEFWSGTQVEVAK